GLAFPGEPDPVAVVDPRRHLHGQRLDPAHAPAAAALSAGRRDHRARALAGRAGLLDREKALLHAHLAEPAAGRTGDGLGAGLGAAAGALVAGDLRRDLDRHLVAR